MAIIETSESPLLCNIVPTRRKKKVGTFPTFLDVNIVGTPPSSINFGGIVYGNPSPLATNLNTSRSNAYRGGVFVPITPVQSGKADLINERAGSQLNYPSSSVYRYTVVAIPSQRTGNGIVYNRLNSRPHGDVTIPLT